MPPRVISRRMLMPAYFKVAGIEFRNELKLYEQTQWWPRDRLQDLTLQRLRAVIASAARLDFYGDRFRACGLDAPALKSVADIARLPILEKSELPLIMAGVGGSGLRRSTAGTSGSPAVVLASRYTQAASLAARYRCYAWYGVRLGDREARFWGRPLQQDGVLDRMKNLALNRLVFDYRHVTPESAADALRRVVAGGADYLYGYSSLLMRFAGGLGVADTPHVPGLKLIVTTAEASTAAERHWLGRVLGGVVADEYGCSETDIIAFTCPEGGRHLMSENVLVETLPVDGQPGLSEIVVTDLTNTLMPMLRYRLGDLVRLSERSCSCGRTLPLLEEIRGRSRARFILTPDGRSVHVSLFAYFMEERQRAGVPIRQFQIIQKDISTLEVKIVLDAVDQAGIEELALQVEHVVRTHLGAAVACSVVSTSEIVPEPGRKFEYFVSEMAEGDPS